MDFLFGLVGFNIAALLLKFKSPLHKFYGLLAINLLLIASWWALWI